MGGNSRGKKRREERRRGERTCGVCVFVRMGWRVCVRVCPSVRVRRMKTHCPELQHGISCGPYQALIMKSGTCLAWINLRQNTMDVHAFAD